MDIIQEAPSSNGMTRLSWRAFRSRNRHETGRQIKSRLGGSMTDLCPPHPALFLTIHHGETPGREGNSREDPAISFTARIAGQRSPELVNGPSSRWNPSSGDRLVGLTPEA